MKSVSHLKIQCRNFPFPLRNNTMSVPQWCTLCWSDSLPTCHVSDPSRHLSLARSIGTRLIPHTTTPTHTHAHPAHRDRAASFLPLPPPLGGFSIYLFLCMCHTRQNKTDSGGFKLVRREQIVFSPLMVQLTTGWVFLLGKRSLQELPVKGQLWEHRRLRYHSQPARSKESPKGRTALLWVLCPLILFDWRGSSWQLQHSNAFPH